MADTQTQTPPAQDIALVRDLHKYCELGRFDLVELFVQKNPDLVDVADTGGTTALHYAMIARENNLGIAKLLIKNGADVNAKNSNRVTPLHLAARQGNAAVVKLLLKSGADTNVASIPTATAVSIDDRLPSGWARTNEIKGMLGAKIPDAGFLGKMLAFVRKTKQPKPDKAVSPDVGQRAQTAGKPPKPVDASGGTPK